MSLKIFFQPVRRAFILGTAIGLVSMLGAFTFKEPGKPDKPEGGLLWEISGKGLPQPSYLYGTIHVICPQDLVMNETIKAKLRSTRQLALETDMDDPNAMAVLMREAAMKDGSNLRSLLTAAEYAKVQSFFSQNPDLQLIETWKPVMLIGMLSGKMEECKQPLSYEDIFMKMAQEQGKEIIGIETIEALMASFDKIPYKNQARMLIESLDRMEEERQWSKQLITLYKQQDLEGIHKLSKKGIPEMGKLGEALLAERNKNWIPVMEQQAKGKPTFFAVGAGHLGGSDGVIELLRQAGYTVKPVPPDDKSR
jgi:uncharacterized protein